MIAVLDPADYGERLTCTAADAKRFVRQWMEPLEAFAAPLPPRAPKACSVRTTGLPSASAGDDASLF